VGLYWRWHEHEGTPPCTRLCGVAGVENAAKTACIQVKSEIG